MNASNHPSDPRSNISKFTGYDPEKYTLTDVSLTVRTDEGLTPGKPPCQTQQSIGKYLQPLTRELSMVPPSPTIDELPDKVIDEMVKKDKAFWVDKPGANAYTLHDAYYNYGMTTEIIKPTHQDVFPRSYQYDLDCTKYRRSHACDGLKPAAPGESKICYGTVLRFVFALNTDIARSICRVYRRILYVDQLQERKEFANITDTAFRVGRKPVGPHCRDCANYSTPGLTPFQLTWAKDEGQKRWRYYPDLTATLSPEQIRNSMAQVGRPYRHEACNWYYKNYPSIKYDCIMRKFSK